MRFLCIYKPAAAEGVPPSQEHMRAMGQLIEEMTKAGVLLGTEGCQPSAKGARVRREGGKVRVIDGPFAEAKEIIGGFALITVRSKDEAIMWAKRFLDVAGDGESEIRQLHEMEDFGPELTDEMREHEARLRREMAANN
jgi:hypothetical protein